MTVKLRDADYLDLHLAAVAALAKPGEVPWYDAHFLRRYEAAKLYLTSVAPEVHERFVAGFAPLQSAKVTALRSVDAMFDQAVQTRIRDVVAAIPKAMLERHENQSFGRDVVHDHPYFLQLQNDILPLVSELAGCELVAGYNFLSLYGRSGRCPPHMDEPVSMYTLDYCIDQSGEWPIHFSAPVEWPSADVMRDWDADALKNDASLGWKSHVLKPNGAVLFNGSSRWHYRDAIAHGGFCNLLFFHYFPAGCETLVYPQRWAEHFDLAVLQPLCDLFGDDHRDGLV